MLTACPNCDSNWNLEEIYLQECDSCMYPFHEEEEIEADDLDDEFYEEGGEG